MTLATSIVAEEVVTVDLPAARWWTPPLLTVSTGQYFPAESWCLDSEC